MPEGSIDSIDVGNESDIRVLMSEMRHMHQDQRETNIQLKQVAKSLQEVATNMTADRGRVDHLEARTDKMDEKLGKMDKALRGCEDFITIERPKVKRRDRLISGAIGGVITLILAFIVKNVLYWLTVLAGTATG